LRGQIQEGDSEDSNQTKTVNHEKSLIVKSWPVAGAAYGEGLVKGTTESAGHGNAPRGRTSERRGSGGHGYQLPQPKHHSTQYCKVQEDVSLKKKAFKKERGPVAVEITEARAAKGGSIIRADAVVS